MGNEILGDLTYWGFLLETRYVREFEIQRLLGSLGNLGFLGARSILTEVRANRLGRGARDTRGFKVLRNSGCW